MGAGLPEIERGEGLIGRTHGSHRERSQLGDPCGPCETMLGARLLFISYQTEADIVYATDSSRVVKI